MDSKASSSSSTSAARFVDRLRRCWPRLERWGILALRLLLVALFPILACAARGFRSTFRLSSAAHCLVLCCSLACLAALSGFLCLLAALIVAAAVFVFLGLAPALALVLAFSAVVLWMHGSFWTTSVILLVTGALFLAQHRKLACALILAYSTYSTRSHCGWRGLTLCTGIAFVSTDVLVYFLEKTCRKNKGVQESAAACRESEASPEEEVTRVLECTDHYAVLGFPRFDSCDETVVKREYRKKAMLVHPDKNKGNAKAEEAFKRLQNAYEVLLDTVKKKCYDEDLQREDLLTSFRNSLSAHKNGRCTNAGCACKGCRQHDSVDEALDARPIVCMTCRKMHMWIATDRVKQHARWCQECEEFHSAKDGDGWVEQSFSGFLFGLFRKVNPPQAYACAGSLVYDVTEWAVCQGVKCLVNTHKPSFFVGATGAAAFRGSSAAASTRNDSTGREHEFYEWLERAMRGGGSGSSASSSGGGGGGGGSSSSSSSSSSKQPHQKSGGRKKRRGNNKKQW